MCRVVACHSIFHKMHPSWLNMLPFFVFCFFFTLSSAHMVDVVAGKKECFFEDLHKNDKVCHDSDSLGWCLNPPKMTISYQVGDGGHLDIDFWVRIPRPCYIMDLLADVRLQAIRPRSTPPWKTCQTVDWVRFDYCRERWET
jgi:hypothetical protein